MALNDDKESVFKVNLIKIVNQSLEGLNTTINEINHFQRKDFDFDSNLSFYQIQNLRTNLNSIEQQFDAKIKFTLRNIQEDIQNLSDDQSFLHQLDLFFHNLTHDILLKRLFSSIGLVQEIESIISLFTGFGVLGIVPFRTTFILNNTASEIMFIDKLEELNHKLRLIIQILQNYQTKQMEILHQFFNK